MARLRRQTTTGLMTTFVGVMLAVWPPQSAVAAAEPNQLAFAVAEPNQSAVVGAEPNLPSGSNIDTQLFKKMMLSVVLVIVLGIAALYVSKKVLPKLANMPGKRIRVVETAHLGPRRSVHLLEVDNRCILVGSTNERITKLADITNAESDFSAEYASRIENENDR